MRVKCAIAIGNPFDGLRLVGPFEDDIEAIRYADTEESRPWVVVEIEEPCEEAPRERAYREYAYEDPGPWNDIVDAQIEAIDRDLTPHVYDDNGVCLECGRWVSECNASSCSFGTLVRKIDPSDLPGADGGC